LELSPYVPFCDEKSTIIKYSTRNYPSGTNWIITISNLPEI
jgi:hypothetical protein